MPGYTATQNADGTWNVLDVPVFGPLPAGVRKANGKQNPEIDAAWLRAAVVKSKQRETENSYLGPLHVRHTGDDAPKIPAGKFRLTRVGKMPYEGKTIDALFADYVGVPAAVYAQFKRGELHFRSIECFDWDSGEIHEIALLESETPYFRYGWAGIEREFPNAGSADAWTPTRGDLAASPAAAFCAVGAGGVALFAFDDPKDEDEKNDKDDAKSKCPKCGHEFAASDDEDQEPKERPPVDKNDTDKDHAQMTALSGEVATLKASVASLVGEKGDLIAKLSVLEAKDRDREAKASADALVAKAREALTGYNFSADVESHVRVLATMDKPGERIDGFVAMCKARFVKDPPTSMDRSVSRGAFSADPPELAKLDPKHLDMGRECVAEFNAAKGKSFTGTLKEYLDINMPGKLRALESAGAGK